MKNSKDRIIFRFEAAGKCFSELDFDTKKITQKPAKREKVIKTCKETFKNHGRWFESI